MAMSDAPERAAQGGKGRWLQLGMLSATLAAPLIARWRGLRADDRAQALRKRAETLRERATARLAEATQAGRSFQRSFQERNARHDTSATQPNAAEALTALRPLAAIATVEDTSRHRSVRASLWLAGVSAGLIAAGAVTYIIIRNRALASAEREALIEMTHLSSEPLLTPEAGERPITEAPPSREPGLAPLPVFSDADAEGAEWVGDIYTRAYMAINDLDGVALPEHDRRIYFASEEQAIAAGYHRAGEAPGERE